MIKVFLNTMQSLSESSTEDSFELYKKYRTQRKHENRENKVRNTTPIVIQDSYPNTQSIVIQNSYPKTTPIVNSPKSGCSNDICQTCANFIGFLLMIMGTIFMLLSIFVKPSNNEIKSAQCYIKDVKWVSGNEEFIGTVESNVLDIKNIEYISNNFTYQSKEYCDKFDPTECLQSNKTSSCEVKYTNNKIQDVSIAKFPRLHEYLPLVIISIVLYIMSMICLCVYCIMSCCDKK